MSSILCAKSGITFRTEHFTAQTAPLYLSARESYHPIFTLSTSELLDRFTTPYLDQKLTEVEEYLLYVALFNSTGLVQFREPAAFTATTTATVARNMPALLRLLETITDISYPHVQERLNLPQFIVTYETASLENSNHWIAAWYSNYSDYTTGYKTATALERLSRAESNLERLIKDQTKDVSTYAHQLANWAMKAGNVDTNYVVANEYNKPEQLTSYWSRIIKACVKMEAIFEIPSEDFECLVEYMEDEIPQGSIYAHSLMSLLRSGAAKKESFVNIGDIDIGSNGALTFRILDANASIEDANKLALIDSAPASKPIEANYPNKLAYIRAKMNYDMKLAYEAKPVVDGNVIVTGDNNFNSISNVNTTAANTNIDEVL